MMKSREFQWTEDVGSIIYEKRENSADLSQTEISLTMNIDHALSEERVLKHYTRLS